MEESTHKEASSEGALEKASTSQRDWMRVAAYALALWVALGCLMFPWWWYYFFFSAGLLRPAYWSEGWLNIALYLRYSPMLLLVSGMVILAAVWILIDAGRRNRAERAVLNVSQSPRLKRVVIVLGAIGAFRLAAFMLGQATPLQSPTPMPTMQVESIPESAGGPLGTPTTLLFLDKVEVESLYNQTEDDMVPTKIVSELSRSSEVKAGLTVKDLLKTEAGKGQLEKTIAEYRETVKTPERKLKELLAFLEERDKLPQLGPFKPSSDEVKRLEGAVELLTEEHGITLPAADLARVREKIFAKELDEYEKRLAGLHGLLLVSGDWVVGIEEESLVARRALVEGIASSPACEFRLSASELPGRFRDVALRQRGAPLRLTVFGKLITGFTQRPRPGIVQPIAVF